MPRTYGSVMRSIRVRQINLNREWHTYLDALDYTGMDRIEARIERLDRHADRVIACATDQQVAALQGWIRNVARCAGSVS